LEELLLVICISTLTFQALYLLDLFQQCGTTRVLMSTSAKKKSQASRSRSNNHLNPPSVLDTLISRKTLRGRWECSNETIRSRPSILSQSVTHVSLRTLRRCCSRSMLEKGKPAPRFGRLAAINQSSNNRLRTKPPRDHMQSAESFRETDLSPAFRRIYSCLLLC
jgi:hypothetical protein